MSTESKDFNQTILPQIYLAEIEVRACKALVKGETEEKIRYDRPQLVVHLKLAQEAINRALQVFGEFGVPEMEKDQPNMGDQIWNSIWNGQFGQNNQ